MANKIKVVIPMGGRGTRLRPHTWSKPKQMVSVAGKYVLDHVLDSLKSLPADTDFELVGIVGQMGEQIETHVREHYPDLQAHFVVQENPRGQSHAIQLAAQHLDGPMLMVFADTLIQADLSCLGQENAEAVAWVKAVADPRRFGVAVPGADGWVERLIEKPQDLSHNLAVVGFYYFQDAALLLKAIEEQMRRNIQLKGEFYLADAINIMLERGLRMRLERVQTWLDAGTPEALLETNRYLLEHGCANSAQAGQRPEVVIIPPVYIHPTAQVKFSIVGPYVSIGAACQVEHCILQDTILEDEAQAQGVILDCSLVGRRASLRRRSGVVNAGDNTEITL